MFEPVLIFTMLGLVLGIIIVFADWKFYVAPNAKVEKIISILPNANCGACGFAGCTAFAQALSDKDKKAKLNGCVPGGADTAGKIASILGDTDGENIVAKTAKIHCKGGIAEARERAIYDGIPDCLAAVLVANGSKECEYGCLGFGNCVKACPFGAISVNKNGVAVINDEKCTGCGACLSACPRKLIETSPETQKVFVACSNHDKGSKVKQYCSVGCTGCSICAKSVGIANSIVMDNFLPKLDCNTGENFIVASRKCPSHSFTDLVKVRPTVNIDTKCTGCGNCTEACPINGAIEGERGERHSVNKNLCIGCGRCIASCEAHAIGIWGALAYSERYRLSRNRGQIS
ncbi:MAG: RnfABCDGE type electron transport complex subunit B [Chitinispirillales bacterium]|jgi:Na+-translocating ferredoxin:NAD+ oxidoreductase RNF subunit RnfB|nr:RnfABCDGE type electron transport complex subunit B [Chitinispirillales bacterium]